MPALFSTNTVCSSLSRSASGSFKEFDHQQRAFGEAGIGAAAATRNVVARGLHGLHDRLDARGDAGPLEGIGGLGRVAIPERQQRPGELRAEHADVAGRVLAQPDLAQLLDEVVRLARLVLGRVVVLVEADLFRVDALGLVARRVAQATMLARSASVRLRGRMTWMNCSVR